MKNYDHILNNPDRLKALQTLCGGLHFDLTRYNQRHFTEGSRDYQRFCNCLGIDVNAVYGTELVGFGFRYFCKELTFTYSHDDWSHERRIITIVPNDRD